MCEAVLSNIFLTKNFHQDEKKNTSNQYKKRTNRKELKTAITQIRKHLKRY